MSRRRLPSLSLNPPAKSIQKYKEKAAASLFFPGHILALIRLSFPPAVAKGKVLFLYYQYLSFTASTLNAFLAALHSQSIPSSYSVASSQACWQQAMKEELDALHQKKKN